MSNIVVLYQHGSEEFACLRNSKPHWCLLAKLCTYWTMIPDYSIGQLDLHYWKSGLVLRMISQKMTGIPRAKKTMSNVFIGKVLSLGVLLCWFHTLTGRTAWLAITSPYPTELPKQICSTMAKPMVCSSQKCLVSSLKSARTSDQKLQRQFTHYWTSHHSSWTSITQCQKQRSCITVKVY